MCLIWLAQCIFNKVRRTIITTVHLTGSNYGPRFPEFKIKYCSQSTTLILSTVIMPAVLPGLCYDESRKRYFPISSQPNRQTIQSIPTQSHQIPELFRGDNGSRQQYTPWRISQTRMISPSYATVMRESQYVCRNLWCNLNKWTSD